MPSVLGSLFDTPAPAPTMPQINVGQVLQQGASYNQGQLSQFQTYAPGSASFMQNLYQTLSPQVQQSQNTNFALGNQLATQGYSNAQSNALNYYRTLGLETAAATGAPVSSQYAQNLGGNIAASQILQNQEAGSSLLNQTSQFQNTLSNQDIAPALQNLSANLINPTSLLQPAEYNNQIQGENAEINYANSQATSWFNTLLSKTIGNVVATPFNFVSSGASVIGNSPQLFASMFAGSGAMQGGNGVTTPGVTGSNASVTGASAGGSSSGGLFSMLSGGGGGSGGLLAGLL